MIWSRRIGAAARRAVEMAGVEVSGVVAERAERAIREEAHAEGVLMGGWGEKQGGRVKSWKRRWFTLRRLETPTLHFHLNPSSSGSVSVDCPSSPPPSASACVCFRSNSIDQVEPRDRVKRACLCVCVQMRLTRGRAQVSGRRGRVGGAGSPCSARACLP